MSNLRPASELAEKGSKPFPNESPEYRTARTKLRDGSETLDDRSRLYGEMLVTCAACHTSLAVSPH